VKSTVSPVAVHGVKSTVSGADPVAVHGGLWTAEQAEEGLVAWVLDYPLATVAPFLLGMARAVDLSGEFDRSIVTISPEQVDAQALMKDWVMVGSDLSHALVWFDQNLDAEIQDPYVREKLHSLAKNVGVQVQLNFGGAVESQTAKGAAWNERRPARGW